MEYIPIIPPYLANN